MYIVSTGLPHDGKAFIHCPSWCFKLVIDESVVHMFKTLTDNMQGKRLVHFEFAPGIGSQVSTYMYTFTCVDTSCHHSDLLMYTSLEVVKHIHLLAC